MEPQNSEKIVNFSKMVKSQRINQSNLSSKNPSRDDHSDISNGSKIDFDKKNWDRRSSQVKFNHATTKIKTMLTLSTPENRKKNEMID